jgi:hypothetical protein
MTIRTSRPTGAWIMALGALAGCGGEEAFTLQLGNTERLIDSEAVAQLSNQEHLLENLRVVGDLDGDGIDDAVIATYTMAEVDAGRPGDKQFVEKTQVYVVYGGSQLHGAIDLATLPVLTMDRGSRDSIAAVGDVDGDGLADFLVSASFGAIDVPVHGGVYLVYGDRTRLTGAKPMASVGALLRDPETFTDALSMAALGDFDGDGKADFALGRAVLDTPADRLRPPDEVLVFYGRSARLSGTVDLLATADATIAESLSSVVSPYLIGAGDVDGDGLGDLIVSTNASTQLDSWRQEMRLVRGSATRLAGTVALADVAHTRLPDNACPPPGGIDVGAGLGDLDGDGADDFTVIACDNPSVAPKDFTYVHRVFYGRKGGMPAQLTDADAAATVHPSVSGFQSGNFSQMIGGDIDGDGMGDLILADESVRDSQGGVHLIRGGPQRFSGSIDPTSQSALTYVGAPFRMPGCSGKDCTRPELVGRGISVGDLTGDKQADVIVGARGFIGADSETFSSPSRAYVVSPPPFKKP